MSVFSERGSKVANPLHPFDHGPHRSDLGLTDRPGRLHVEDHAVVGVDQVVGGIGKVGRTAPSPGPLRGRIGMRGELRLDRARSAECGIVERFQVFPDGPRRVYGIDAARLPVRLRRGVLPVRVSLDDTGVRGEALAAGQAFCDAPGYHGLEEMAQQVAVAEAAMTVLGEGRMIRHRHGQIKAAEPEVGEVEMDLLAEPVLGPDAVRWSFRMAPGADGCWPGRRTGPPIGACGRAERAL